MKLTLIDNLFFAAVCIACLLVARISIIETEPTYDLGYVLDEVDLCLNSPTFECLATSRYLLGHVSSDQVADSIPHSQRVYLVDQAIRELTQG